MPISILDKTELIDKIVSNIPKNILDSKIWLAYYFQKKKDGTYTKPPCARQGHTVEEDQEGVTFWEAVKDGYPGIKINKHTDLIAFDIDDKEAKLGKRPFDLKNLSDEFIEFMAEHDSYTELSPSKCGLRILMSCKDKSNLFGRVNLSKELCIGGELFMNSGYVSITGDHIVGTSISTIEPEDLKKWYISNTEKIEKIDKVEFSDSLPSLNLVLEALRTCFLDQRTRVKVVYKTIINQEYNHYDYWMKIMSACHDYALKANQMTRMMPAVVEWSQTDEAAYENEEDVIKHWSSLTETETETGITFHTLFKFAKMLKFQWPDEAYDKNGNPTGKPLINSLENFQYLIDYYNIKIYRDIFDGRLYVKADEDVLDKYFLTMISESFFGMVGPFTSDSLKGIFWELSQKNGYINIASGTIYPLVNKFFKTSIKPINMLKAWLDTPPDQLPKDMVEKNTDLSKSNLNHLISCIEFRETQNADLARNFLETFFFEMMMPLYNLKRKYSQRSFMLVMTGPENCRKTTFFSMLFPANLRRQFVTNSTETLGGAKSIRDFSTSLVSSALVVSDEFEIFYNKKNDSLFKTYVTSDVVDYVPIYEKTMRKEYKNAVLAGTTNKRSLAFEQDSNRRLAILDVKFIDTSSMECINWHHFYRDFIDRGKKAMRNGIHSWKISDETIQLQYEVNEEFRSQSNLEIILRETFDFDMKTHKKVCNYDSGNIQSNINLSKMSDILGTVKQRYPSLNIKPAELKHLLKRLCGSYTQTTHKTYQLHNSKGFINSGIVKQGQWTRYTIPPILTDFD